VRVFNTMTRTKEELVPITPGEIRMYSCGVTVYDLSHVGHAKMMIVFDVIARYLRFAGYRVTFVRNFTDIEDKIIRRANEEGVPAREISERYIAAFRDDIAALGVQAPEVEPKATDHVPEMIALIERLVSGGYAYVVDGDVYFEVRRFPAYGKLSGKNLDELLAGARVDVDERKRDPRDFALWKAAKPDEPAWPSPWGPGRPGWHIECSAMAMRYLGESFDIHGGGEDLIFPHHECEIAQAEAVTHKPFARYWVHNGFVNMGKDKMSKSLGNTLTIRDIVKRHDPEALRLWILGTHYRHLLEWSDERVEEAARALARLTRVVDDAASLGAPAAAVPAAFAGFAARWTTTSTRRRRSACCSNSRARCPTRATAASARSRRAPISWRASVSWCGWGACSACCGAASRRAGRRRRSSGSSPSARTRAHGATGAAPTSCARKSSGSAGWWRTRRAVHG